MKPEPFVTRLKRSLLGLPAPAHPGDHPAGEPRADMAGALRIQLGCGQDPWPGYVNVDRDPGAKADVFEDSLSYLARLEQNCAAEIVSIHSLGYLALWDARMLMAQAFRVLRPQGALIIELPDLAKCAANALEAQRSRNLEAYIDAIRGFFAFGRDTMQAQEDYTPYAFGWSAWHLELELRQAGFTDVQTCAPRTHDVTGKRDTRVEARKA